MNELTVKRLRLTPENMEQLRGLAEAIEHGTARFITYEADLAARAFREIERLQAEMERLQDEMERLHGALNISPDDVGRIMHESWSQTKRSQGFHHPSECPNGRWVETAHGRSPCPKCHADLIPWDNLPEPQKDINRHAFDDVLAEIRRRAAIAERGRESG